MSRFMFAGALLCLGLVAVSGQFNRFARSDTVDPSAILRSITNRNSIRKTASGLPFTPVVRTDIDPIPERSFRQIATEANSSIPVGGGGRIDRPTRTSFAFGPQLLSSNTARNIGRQGRVFLETARRLIQSTPRVASRSGGSQRQNDVLPALAPGATSFLDCPFNQQISCDRRSPYRTITGICNNLRNPIWGSSNTPFERSSPSAYNDGLSEPRSKSVLSGDLPLARVVSTSIHTASDTDTLDARFTQITMEFGQYVSHDIERFAPSTDLDGEELVCCDRPRPDTTELGCLPLEIPANDPFFGKFNRRCMEFARALPTPQLNCNLGPRGQLNQETAYLDGSAVHGSTVELSNELRAFHGGLLKTTPSQDGELLLQDPDLRRPECRSQSRKLCFKAGDPRVNQQPALMSMHTLWLREHNRLARELSGYNPSWDDEKLFQEARKILSAEFQHVVYDEFLPVIVGREVAEAFDFPAKKFGYNSDYEEGFNAQIRSAFSAAGYRFGHSLVQRFFAKNLEFRDHFLRPDTMYQSSRGPSFVIKDLFSKQQQKCDRLISDQLTTTLFETVPGNGIDLAATNIHRGRDFGIPSYNVFRVLCGLSRVTHFGTWSGGLVDHTARTAQLMRETYAHVDDIDLWTGAVSEKVIRGAVVGPTIACVIGRQFFLLKKGDRFFYENDDRYAKFPLRQLDEIRKTSLARIICDNTKADKIQPQAFRTPDFSSNRIVSCNEIPSVDLSQWGGTCSPVDGGWSGWQPFTRCFSGFRFRFRTCTNPASNACGKPCKGTSFWAVSCGRSRIKGDEKAIARKVAPKGVVIV